MQKARERARRDQASDRGSIHVKVRDRADCEARDRASIHAKARE